MTKEQLKITLNEVLNQEDFIYKILEDEIYFYAFTKNKKLKGIDFDDRYSRVGGLGPFRVNKRTKEITRINYSEIPSFLIRKKRKTNTIDSIGKAILKRKYINVNDTYNFLKINYKKADDFNFGKVLTDFKEDKNLLSLNFKDTILKNRLIDFLKSLNVKFSLKDENWLLIIRTLENINDD